MQCLFVFTHLVLIGYSLSSFNGKQIMSCLGHIYYAKLLNIQKCSQSFKCHCNYNYLVLAKIPWIISKIKKKQKKNATQILLPRAQET